MSIARAKVKSKSKRSAKRSGTSDCCGSASGALVKHSTAPVHSSRLGAFYSAGPTLALGTPVQTELAVDDQDELEETSPQPFLVQRQVDEESQEEVEETPQQFLIQRQAEEESEEEPETTGEEALQPFLVQRQAETAEPEKDEPVPESDVQRQEGGNGRVEPVQLWDCDEYDEPTCVQTQEAASKEQVQAECTTCEAEERVQHQGSQARSPRVIRRAARSGLKGATRPLPHGERIQAAFGHHDVSRVRTSVGGGAGTANRRMGALAFTSGDRIGFRDTPSLRLAAHEATHAVQQRQGLSLPDNVGRAGDPWERHADRVADAVVGGRSAEAVLDEVAEPDAPSSEGVEGGADDTLTAPAPDVQQQITSGASRLFEPPPVPAELPEPAAEGEAEISEESPEEAEPSDRGEEESALEAAEEGDSEAPPEGVPAEGEAPAGGGTPAPGAGGETAEGTEAPSGGGISAPCYNVDPPPPPDNAAEPSSDDRGSEPEEEPQVEFEPWPDEVDECPAEETVAEGGQQMPEGIGEGSEMAGGVLAADGALAAASGSESGAAASETATEGGAPSGSSEVQAMSRAATTGADQSVAEASAMDGQIASAEGERDAAVNDYLASTDGLRDVIARSQSLESGVTFPSADGLQQFEARQAAIAETRDFMARSADQIAAAAAFAQEQVPEILRDAAESTKADIQDAIEAEKTAISGRIAQARAQARAGAAAARAHVNAEYANSAAVIESVTIAAIAVLDTKHTTSVALVDEKETAGLDDVNSRFATGRTQHEAKGPEYADLAIARGQEHAHKYERCKRHPETKVNYDDDGFWDGCLTVRRARAQQDTACKTAAGYKDVFLRTANKKGYDLRELRKRYRCAVIAGARQVNQTLDDTHTQLVSGLESGRAQALDGITLARDENLAAINDALAATLKSLSAQEFSQRQAVNDTGYLKQLAAEQLAHSGAASLARGISAAMDSLEQTLTTLREGFAQGDIPDPASLAQSLAVTEAALGGGMGMLLDTMAEGAQQAVESIEGLGAAALEALALLTAKNDELSAQTESGFAQQMGSLKTGASNTFGQLTENHVQQAQQAMTDGTASMDQAVAGFDEALATIGGRVDEAIDTSLQELDQDLSNKLGELDGQITREAWKAAEKEQPAWKSVVAIILVILVIIAAAVISIVTLGAGASLFAVILVGALVGAVSGGLIQLINNWASGEAWHQGLVQAMVMGAIGGAIGGGLGFAGGALSAAAGAAGARVATQVAITVGADLLAEGLTQTVGYVAFGQKFNWQGFVMAGAMSGVSFRATRPGGPRAGAPRAAGAAAGRRAAVTQVAGGAALGLGVEYVTAKISGQEFDLTRAASAAASGAVGARMARRGGPTGPTPEPTTRLGRAAERFRTFDPGGVGARLETRLRGLGGRIGGAPPDVDLPTGARPRGDEPAIRPIEEPGAPRPRTGEEPAPAARTQPGEPEVAPRRAPTDEPGVEPGRKPIDADTAAELAGPANRMNEQDLIDATTTRARVGDADHDFRVNRDGPEVCTACAPTIQRLTEMINALTPGPLRSRLEALRVTAGDVQTRLANGESGVNMVRDSARIAAEFRALGKIHPSLGRPLQEPHLRRTTIEGPEGAVMMSPHLRDLDAEVVRTERVDIENFRSSSLKRGENAIYILRDSSGAVLKVGVAERGPGRFSKYLTARNNLGLELELEIAVVNPRGGKTIRNIETDLRTRLEDEGHVLPWDNARRDPTDPLSYRLGRGGQGTPFVRKSREPFAWTTDGRRIPIPETVANLRQQGKSNAEIVDYLANHTTSRPSTIRKWFSRFKTQIKAAEDTMTTNGGD